MRRITDPTNESSRRRNRFDGLVLSGMSRGERRHRRRLGVDTPRHQRRAMRAWNRTPMDEKMAHVQSVMKGLDKLHPESK